MPYFGNKIRNGVRRSSFILTRHFRLLDCALVRSAHSLQGLYIGGVEVVVHEEYTFFISHCYCATVIADEGAVVFNAEAFLAHLLGDNLQNLFLCTWGALPYGVLHRHALDQCVIV